MTADECITWLQGRIAAFLPTDDMASGDVSIRLPQLMMAMKQVAGGAAFGFTFPAETRDECISRATPALERALDTWRAWLAGEFGDEGREFFEGAALQHGLKKPEPKTVRRDPAIAAALGRLRTRLADTAAATAYWTEHSLVEPGEAVGFAVAPSAPDLGEVLAAFELDGPPLPAELEALYAEMNGLWVDVVDAPGGESELDPDAERLVFTPIESLIDHYDDRDDGLVILDRDPDYFAWTMMRLEDGTIQHATKLDGDEPPRKVADSLAAYLDLLAEHYGTSGG